MTVGPDAGAAVLTRCDSQLSPAVLARSGPPRRCSRLARLRAWLGPDVMARSGSTRSGRIGFDRAMLVCLALRWRRCAESQASRSTDQMSQPSTMG